MEFDGLVAVVTGAASGIGSATARMLAARGATVACLDLSLEGVEPPVVGFQADVTDDVSVRAAIAAVGEAYGRIDIVVNNAAIGAVGTIADNDDETWHRILDVDVVGVVRVTRAALPWLIASPTAAVVNVGSMAGWSGTPARALYSAAKGAVLALTLAMAADHVKQGIRVNCVNPGTADTPWVQRLMSLAEDPAGARAALERRQPTGRLVTPDEIAHAICFLASPLSSSTTGAVLAVDGGIYGLRMPPPS